MTRPPFTAPTEADLAAVQEQLGRPPRGVLGIAARMPDGSPAVVATEPRLPDGTPFPTLYYMTHPLLTAAMSRLEADGFMVRATALLQRNAAIAAQYAAAHQQYLEDRAHFGNPEEIHGISAGGMPTRVKCLHALAGHSLAAGPGLNPIGDLALAAIGHPGFADITVPEGEEPLA